jgi:M6 family metalloprotease-like protein
MECGSASYRFQIIHYPNPKRRLASPHSKGERGYNRRVFLFAVALSLAPHVFVGGEPPPRVAAQASLPPCSIVSTFPNFLTEGPVDDALHAPSTGAMRAVLLFAEFPDAPATETTNALFETIGPDSQEWLHEASHGRFTLEITPVHRWYRMPLPSRTYGLEVPTFASQRAYAEELVRLADADVDFSAFDTILIASPPNASIPNSPTFLAYPGGGVRTNEKELRWGVTFGVDVRVPQWGGRILAHETLHMLGLPDLYRFGLAFPEAFRDAGGWDHMSWLRPAAHPLVWHKRKLGWIDESQIVCAQHTTDIPLQPSASTGGVKAVLVQIDADTMLVAELRKPVAFDARLCDSGVLLYTVEASAFTGNGPVTVHTGGSRDNGACGPKFDATFDLRDGKIATFTHPQATIEVHANDVVRVIVPNKPKRRAVRR